MLWHSRPIAWMIAFAGLLAASAPAPARADDQVLVFAAASLKNALDKVNVACAAEAGGQATVSYAATSALARQIEEGAPADIFFAADLDWMQRLAEQKLIRSNTVRQLLGNEMVLVVPADSTASLTIAAGFDLAGLIADRKLAMANVDAVPAGRYGKAALAKLGVWDNVKEKVIQAQNVRIALALVASGEAAAGIVYATDAKAEPKVRVVGTFPADSHPPIVYPVAETTASEGGGASGFLACLTSAKAAEIFTAAGFSVLPPD